MGESGAITGALFSHGWELWREVRRGIVELMESSTAIVVARAGIPPRIVSPL